MTALHDFLQPMLEPVKLVRAKQNVSRLPKPYATYFIVTNRAPAPMTVYEPDVEGFRKAAKNARITVQVDVYGKNAYEIANKLHSRLGMETFRDSGIPLGIAVFDRTAVTDMTEAVSDTQYEERAMFEFMFHSAQVELEESQYVTAIEGTGALRTGPHDAYSPVPADDYQDQMTTIDAYRS